MADNPVKVVVDNTKAMQDAVEFLATTRVMVGIPAENQTYEWGSAGNERQTTVDGSKRKASTGGITNAALLYIHDNGAPEVGIPARPTLIPGIKSREDDIDKGLKAAGRSAMDGNIQLSIQRLSAVGIIGSSGVKSAINNNTPPPLAPSTLAARKSRGVTRTNTLVDTGQMRNAVNWVLRKVKRGA